MPLTDEEKEGLSPEEIAAIEEVDDSITDPDDVVDNPSTTDPPGDKDTADKVDDEKTKDEEDKSDDEKAEDDRSDAKDAGDDKQDKVETEKSELETEAAHHQPAPPTMPVVDPKELDSAKASFEDAKKKFEDGDIDFQQFDEAKTAFYRLKWKDEDAREYNKHAREYQWQSAQDSFFSSNAIYRDNETLNAAYVAKVNSLLTTDEGRSLSDAALLNLAKERVEHDLELMPRTKDGAVSKTDKKKDLAAARAANGDRKAIDDGDIAKLPSAEEETDPGEFAHLDKLEGAAYQEAIDRLTPAQLERYEALQ